MERMDYIISAAATMHKLFSEAYRNKRKHKARGHFRVNFASAIEEQYQR